MEPAASCPRLKHLHHVAFRCRDAEETRRFYEDLLGLKLAAGLEIIARTSRHDQILAEEQAKAAAELDTWTQATRDLKRGRGLALRAAGPG